MTSDKKNISLFADLFVKSGLTDIVISPGSRNAPIITSFANRAGIVAISIVDERSAAFFALGLALNSKKTVAIACTSGSAVLNYASAISEAYYQKVPLLVLTADRPANIVDIGDGQTIRQNNIYENYIKNSYRLPVSINSKEEFEDAEEIINEAIHNCVFPQPGPVHINIPFDEPIYGTTNQLIAGNLKLYADSKHVVSENQLQEIAAKWNGSAKVLLIAGQMPFNAQLNNLLKLIGENNNVVVLTETTSNLHNSNFIDTIDNVICGIKDDEIDFFRPEIIVSFGGQVVSKMFKKFIRNNKPVIHWHISPSNEKMDTYFSLTNVVVTDEVTFFNLINPFLVSTSSNYNKLWRERKILVDARKEEYISHIGYSDLKVFKDIIEQLPQNCILHLGNSTPVRYSQLFGSASGIEYNSNRGVSGIDGQVSTAAGYAYASDKVNVLITGDLGFLYDSNGLMNNYITPNLKIIVINNSGGGIFRFIPGPDTTPNLEKYFVGKHNWSAKYICKAFHMNYESAHNQSQLELKLSDFLNHNEGNSGVLEIFTPPQENAKILREYFEHIKD